MSETLTTYLRYPIRSDKFSYSIKVQDHLASVKTDFQQIDIYDTECFGKILTLDGHVQLSSLDDSAYHEALVHIPLLNVSEPKRALVVGGGDGGVLRELVKHPGLKIDMVEIDSGVVEAAQEFLPELSDGAFANPNVNLHIGDAFPFLKAVQPNTYDFIIMDITDTYEEEDGELSEQLFTADFHRDLLNALSPSGVLVSQADNHLFCPYSMQDLLKTLGDIFPKVGSYQSLIPSFGGFSGFVWASKGAHLAPTWQSQFDSVGPLHYLSPFWYEFAFQGLPFQTK